jgi:putative endonuclease
VDKGHVLYQNMAINNGFAFRTFTIKRHWKDMWNYGKRGSQKTGKLGEDIACKFLKKKGFAILERNYRENWGEIDIIAKKKGFLHFVEVKTEKHRESAGSSPHRPEDKVDTKKIARLAHAVDTYMDKKGLDTEWQIDVVSVVLDVEGKRAKCDLIEHVF